MLKLRKILAKHFIRIYCKKSNCKFLFYFREDMEKINIKFHENGTVSFQHRKILEFVPELSVKCNAKLTVPNIPLLVR